MAACIAISNQEEIALARFGEEKSKNDDVKEFTKTLIEDHQAFLKKLQKFAPEARETTLETASTQSPSGVQQAGGTAQAQPGQQARAQQPQAGGTNAQPQIQRTAGQSAQSAVDVVQLHREMAQQCLADTKKALNEKEGHEFDACFIGMQVGKHAAMKSALTVMHRHASGEFAQVIGEGLKTTEEHLQQAEKIMEDMKDSKSKDRDSKSDNAKSGNSKSDSKSENSKSEKSKN